MNRPKEGLLKEWDRSSFSNQREKLAFELLIDIRDALVKLTDPKNGNYP